MELFKIKTLIKQILNKKVSMTPLAVGPENLGKDKNEVLISDSSEQKLNIEEHPFIKNINDELCHIDSNFFITDNEQNYQKILLDRPHKAIVLSIDDNMINFGVFTHNLPKGRGFGGDPNLKGSFLELPIDPVTGKSRYLIFYTAEQNSFNSYLYEGNRVIGPKIEFINENVDFLLSINSGDFLFLLCDFDFFKRQKIDKSVLVSNIESDEVLKYDKVHEIYHKYVKKSSSVFCPSVINGTLNSSSHWLDVATRLAHYSEGNNIQVIENTFSNLRSFNLDNDKMFTLADQEDSSKKLEINSLTIDNSDDCSEIVKSYFSQFE